MRIIIIGAGIAGLTLGLACGQAGIEYRIVEKAKSLRNIGGGILLWPHGIRYLQWLSLADCLEPLLINVKGCNVVAGAGEEIFTEDYDHLNALLGGMVLPADRGQLQQALASRLPAGVLELNKTCVAVNSEGDYARVLFADGTAAEADLVVGADGIHSAVRKSLNKNAVLEYTQHCWWGGIIEQKVVPALAQDRVYLAIGTGKVCIVWPISGGRFMWYIPVKLPREDFIQAGDGRAQLQTLCSGWTEEVRQIISAPSCGQRFHMAIHALPLQTAVSHQRVLLIGDAAHALGPVLGQGASMAIEDVFVLMNCLKLYPGNVQSMLRHYESLRHARYSRIYELEKQSAAMMINDNQEELALFQKQLQEMDLATMYQELISLVDENACLRLAAAILVNSKAA